MKTTFEIEKNESGYAMTLITKRINFLKAFFSGKLTVETDKSQAAVISKALYTPKKKFFPKKASAAHVPPCE
jgi:hypothetical protein